ncbi:hydroxymethylbilane synthase [Chloroflexota bacterium]
MRTRIVVGSRGSKLALIQAESVIAEIRKVNPHAEVSLKKISTAGDRDRRTPLDRMEIAIFVKELEEALLDGRIDIAVHSLKDVPTEIPQGLCLLAVTERLDSRDALVAKSGLNDLAAGSKIGTSSLRRAIQLTQYRPDLKVCSIRGNVDTRLRKVSSGEADGIIVAAAAMLRLGLEHKVTEYLPLEHFLPSVGQGALVIEARSDDREVSDFISPINHVPTWQGVIAERAFLRALGGGCRAPIAALSTVNGATLELNGMIASPDGKGMLHASGVGNNDSPEKVGVQLVQKLIDMGASEFIAEVRSK